MTEHQDDGGAAHSTHNQTAQMLAELSQTEILYRAVVEQTSDGILLFDGESGLILQSNPALQEMLGYSPEELRGMRVHNLILDSAKEVDKNITRTLREGRRILGERTYHRKDGEPLEVEVAANAISYEGRELLCAVVRDISERKRIMSELHKAEERYRTLIEQIPAVTYIERAKGTYPDLSLYTSPQIEKMLGYTLEEWLRPDADLWGKSIHPDDRDRVLAADEHSRSSGEPFKEEYRLIAKDGSVVWVRDETVLLRDESGEPWLWQGVLLDITELKQTEEALKESEERFRSAFENASTGVALVGLDNRYVRVNEALCRMLGYEEDELLGKRSFDVTHPDDRQKSQERTRRMLEEGGPGTQSLEKRYVCKDGRVVWVISDVSLVRDAAGNPSHFVTQFQDITARKRAEESLKESERLQRRHAREQALLHQVRNAYARELELPDMLRAVVETIAYSYGYAQVSAYLLEGTPQQGVLILQHQVGYKTVFERIPASEGISGRVARTGKPALIEDVRDDPDFLGAIEGITSEVCVPLFDEGDVVGLLNVESTKGHVLGEEDLRLMETIAEHVGMSVGRASLYARAREAERRMAHQALHDPLTGLPNRRLFSDRLSQALSRLGRKQNKQRSSVAVLFLDLDDFKLINDSLGHEAGDGLLVTLAEKLGSVLRPSDTLARLSGDEFVILLEEITGAAVDGAVQVAERILSALGEPFEVAGREATLGASIGISLTGGESKKSPGEILREADTAMYRAKASGKRAWAIFEPGMQQQAAERLELEGDLRQVIESGGEGLELLYQPIVCLRSGNISGMEALLRWHHPERGTLLPGRFVPVAERSGLIVPLGRWVLEQVCRSARAWKDTVDGPAPVIWSNLSAAQLASPKLHEKVRSLLAESGLGAGALGFEVIEGAAMGDAPTSAAALVELKRLGARLAIDDFGSGYSSLSYLRRFAVDSLKIDRSFVEGLGQKGSEKEAVVSGIVGLAQGLGLETVAEGVESEKQLTILRSMGCELAQGNHLAPLLTFQRASELIEGTTTAL